MYSAPDTVLKGGKDKRKYIRKHDKYVHVYFKTELQNAVFLFALF